MTARRITIELDTDVPDSEVALVLAALATLDAALDAIPLGGMDAVGEVKRRGQRRALLAVAGRINDAVDQAIDAEAAELAARQAATKAEEAAARRRTKTAARLRTEILDI